MRRLCLYINLLLLCCGLFGCGTNSLPRDEALPTAPPPETQATAVSENSVYFANSLEADRLYRLDLDTGGLERILDERCYAVCRQGDLVYFTNSSGLHAWDIAAGQRKTVQEGADYYEVVGDHLLYSKYQGDYRDDYRVTLHYRNLATGAQNRIRTVDNCMMLTSDRDYAYYLIRQYDPAYDAVYAYDLQEGRESLLYQTKEGDMIYTDAFLAAEGGVLFLLGSGEEEIWLHAKPDGTVQQARWTLPDRNNEPFAVIDGELRYIHHEYGEDMKSQIRQQAPSGKQTVLMQSNAGANYLVQPLREDLWLVEHGGYILWGPYTEYGYQENYSYQVQYSLLHRNGTMTRLNARGELGSLFPDGDFPIIDSSTARKPVTADLYNIFVKNQGYAGAEPLCSTTHGAWLNIADGRVDLALLAAPTPEEQAYLQKKGVEVEMKLYGGDGLVFIGNSENPVQNITHDQLLDIYRGRITNWKELGGPDHPITVYYRDDQSGSQRLFEKLVWKDTAIPDFQALGFFIEDEMSSIVHIVQQEPWSIGYTIMTYLDDVYGEDSLRVFSVNGVHPSPETVADGSYAYHTQGYLVIRKDEPADSPARRLYDWFGCAISDELLHRCGVSPLHG